MTILKTAYDTEIGKVKNQDDANLAIELALKSGELSTTGRIIPINRYENAQASSKIPALLFPRVVKVDDEEKVLIDLRYFQNIITANDTEIKVKNKSEYLVQKSIASFQYQWIHDSPIRLRNLTPFILASYTNWISESLIKRLSLQLHEQAIVKSIAAIYFYSQFQDEEIKGSSDVSALKFISKAVRVDIDTLVDVMDQVPSKIDTLQVFCETLKSVTGSIRLSKLTPGFLITLVTNSWFGVNSREICAASLEHPPTFIGLLTGVINSKIYKNTNIYRAAENASRNKLDDEIKLLNKAANVELYFDEILN